MTAFTKEETVLNIMQSFKLLQKTKSDSLFRHNEQLE